MIRSLLIAVAALSCSACAAVGPVASAPNAPTHTSPSTISTPLASTEVDDKAIVLAFEALDVAATAADTLLAAGIIKPGSDRALGIASGLDSAKTWLNVASRAQRALQAENYFSALAQASAALTSVRLALGSR